MSKEEAKAIKDFGITMEKVIPEIIKDVMKREKLAHDARGRWYGNPSPSVHAITSDEPK